MFIGRLRYLVMASVLSLTLSAGAQSPFAEGAQQNVKGAAPVGGKLTIDLIRLDGASPSVPLRNGGVVAGSEMIDLDGRSLKKGVDYAIDYSSGIVYVMRAVRPGQSLRVTYRFDPTKANTSGGASMLGGPGGFRLDFRGGNSLMMGLGMAERSQDGAVVQSNVYGWKNNFAFKGGSVGGLMVVGDRHKVQAKSLLEPDKGDPNVEEGKSQAIVQNLGTSFLGGKLTGSVQDVSSKFAGFQAFRDAGFDAGYVSQLQKERGLKRYSYGFQDVGTKSFNVSNSFKTVKDKDSSVEWRSLGLNAGALALNWEGRRVNSSFKRFKDLAEGDREQIAKEAGLNTETITGKLGFKGGSTSFRNLSVEDGSGNSVWRRSFGLESTKGSFTYSDQRVESGFRQFQGIRESDAGQLAREQGLRRQSYTLSLAPLFAGATNWTYAASSLKEDTEEHPGFTATNLSIGGKGWSFEQASRSADASMSRLGSMSEPEIQGHMKAIGRMYEPADFGIKPEDRNAFLGGAGLSRNAYRFSMALGQGSSLMVDRLDFKGKADDGSLTRYFYTSPKLNIAFRNQAFGDNFAEASTLMEFERARVGNMAGIQKQDWAADLKLDKNKVLAVNSLDVAKTGEGSAKRDAVSYRDKGFEFNYVNRSIDSGFKTVGQIVDPERELLSAFRGFDQRDISLKWQVLRGLNLDAKWSDAENDETGENRMLHSTVANWSPDKFTRIDYVRIDQRSNDPTQLLFENAVRRLALSRDFGKLGKLSYSRESIDYDGTQTQLPDSDRQTVVYETKLNATTSVKSEQSETKFGDGQRETYSANTLSTEIGKRTGVSVTDIKINRDGDKPDEAKRNYGFWWDFGKGMRLAYGYARDLNSQADGQMRSTTSLTPGNVGGIAVGALSYNEQRWDNQRYVGTGNVQLSSVKPLQLGWLKDVTFRFGADTHRDQWRFLRENRSMAVGARVGTTTFGWEYFSQVAQTGQRAIDRTFRLQTDQTETKPYRASVTYKLRTLPSDQQVMIRNYSLTARPVKGMELTHQLLTNPEVARGDVILGSLTQASRVNKWKLDFANGSSTKLGLAWDELINDQAHTRSRVGGVNLTLFANNPSPLFLYYGVEQGDVGGTRKTAHRYHLRFDQRPGQNQLFSLFAGNVSWQHSRAPGTSIQNWSVRAEYQLRF